MSTTLPMLKSFGRRIEIKYRESWCSSPWWWSCYFVNAIHSESDDEGVVKRVRGVSFSTRVSSQFENIMIPAARGIFIKILPNVYISTHHKSGQQAGKSRGYCISLVAETSSGCCISVDTAFPRGHKLDFGGIEDSRPELTPPDEVSENIAWALLEEFKQGGVVDSTHQGLLLLLCALCPGDTSKVRVGKLSPHGIETLRYIRHFLKVQFDIQADPAAGTVILKCLGSGIKNYSRNLF